jgi:ketosteroid isomerase-like protein
LIAGVSRRTELGLRFLFMLRNEIEKALDKWIEAWNAHDIDGVMVLLHDEVVFENWDGFEVHGRRELRRAWTNWFRNHGDFHFLSEDLFIDEDLQKALFMWELEWPSRERDFEGEREIRRGVDVLYFEGGKIIRKVTYVKTTIVVAGKRVRLTGGE